MRLDNMLRGWGLPLVMMALAVGQVSSAHALELRLGAKAAITLSGMIAVEPQPELSLAPWFDSNAGVGFGGGLYLDMHFTKLIALELDVLFEGNRIFFEASEQGTAGGQMRVVYLEQALVYEQLRIPLLFKLVAHLSQHVEFTGALGPEVLIGVGATPHSALYGVDRPIAIYNAQTAHGFALTAAFGFGFLTKYLHIPIELRFGYNLLGPYSYEDRVTRMSEAFVVKAIENFQFAALVGFGFRIPPEQPPKKPKPVKPVVEVDDPFYYPPVHHN